MPDLPPRGPLLDALCRTARQGEAVGDAWWAPGRAKDPAGALLAHLDPQSGEVIAGLDRTLQLAYAEILIDRNRLEEAEWVLALVAKCPAPRITFPLEPPPPGAPVGFTLPPLLDHPLVLGLRGVLQLRRERAGQALRFFHRAEQAAEELEIPLPEWIRDAWNRAERLQHRKTPGTPSSTRSLPARPHAPEELVADRPLTLTELAGLLADAGETTRTEDPLTVDALRRRLEAARSRVGAKDPYAVLARLRDPATGGFPRREALAVVHALEEAHHRDLNEKRTLQRRIRMDRERGLP